MLSTIHEMADVESKVQPHGFAPRSSGGTVPKSFFVAFDITEVHGHKIILLAFFIPCGLQEPACFALKKCSILVIGLAVGFSS